MKDPTVSTKRVKGLTAAMNCSAKMVAFASPAMARVTMTFQIFMARTRTRTRVLTAIVRQDFTVNFAKYRRKSAATTSATMELNASSVKPKMAAPITTATATPQGMTKPSLPESIVSTSRKFPAPDRSQFKAICFAPTAAHVRRRTPTRVAHALMVSKGFRANIGRATIRRHLAQRMEVKPRILERGT